jgi:aminomethyltransferase
MRHTPLAPRNLPPTAEAIEVNGYAAALEITGFDEEYRAIREGAALYDFSMLHKFDVRGSQALELVDRMVVRDLSKIAPGRVAYGPVVGDDGLMLDDATCLVFGPEHVRVCGGSGLPGAVADCLEGTGLSLAPLRDELAQLNVQGPHTRDLLQPLTETDLSNAAFPYYTHSDGVLVAGIPCFVARLGFSGELGYELWCPADRALELWDALIAHGASFGVRGAGGLAILTARTEAGMIVGDGLDYGPDTSPWECGLGWTVSDSKRRYRGMESLLAARDTAQLRLVTLTLEAEPDGDPTGSSIRGGAGDEVGILGLVVPSPLAGSPLALARIDRELATVGNRVTVEGGIGAVVVPTPLYDPERRNVRS